MTHSSARSRAAAVLAAAWTLSGASVAFGQGLLETSAVLVAQNGDAIPGLGGGETFGGSSTFDSPVLDASGKIFFRGRLVGGGVTTPTERAYFYGSNPGNLVMVARGGDAEPSGTMPGVLLLSSSGAVSGLGSTLRIASNGTMLWSSSLNGTSGSTDDTAWFSGTPGSFSVFVREGQAAPGTAGATMSSSFSSFSHQSSGMNSAGHGWVTSNLTGGDVVGTTNSEGLFAGPAGALVLAARRGDLGPGGEVVADIQQTFIGQMNSAGQVMFDVSYAIGSGSTPVSTTDDRAIWLYTPGVGTTQLVRENDPVTGVLGATYSSASSTPFNTGSTTLNASGTALFKAELSTGPVVLATFNTGGDSILVTQNDPAPGVVGAASFDNFNNSGMQYNDAGHAAFQGIISGALVTAQSDTGIWSTAPGALTLVALEGDVGPGTAGWTFGNFNGIFMMQNAQGKIVFTNTMSTGGTPATVTTYWGWDPAAGLSLISFNGAGVGSQIEVSPGVFKTLSSFAGASQFTNNGGGTLTFADDGTIAFRLGFTDGTGAVGTMNFAPLAPPTAYCTAGTSTNGCVPSISATGTASVAASSGFAISVANVEGNKQGLLYYGLTGPIAAPWGVGGSSFQCVKSPTQRMGVQNSGGVDGTCTGALGEDWLAYLAGNPAALGQPFSSGVVVNAQAWYRDPPAVKTTNLSNALQFVTVP